MEILSCNKYVIIHNFLKTKDANALVIQEDQTRYEVSPKRAYEAATRILHRAFSASKTRPKFGRW